MTWQSAFIPGSKPDGTPVISVIGKRTYALDGGACAPAQVQRPIAVQDTYADPGDPFYSDVAAETDLVAFKPSTDVVFAGKAWAPKGKQAYHLDCCVQVGTLSKTVRVFGDRTMESKALRGLVISDPKPFAEIDIGYSRAYGGTARGKDATLYTYFPNPIGRGFALKGGFEDAGELKVPNLEDPRSPVTADNIVLSRFEDWPSAPAPASLGWTRRNFFPRYTYMGVLPEFLAAAEKSREIMTPRNPRLANTAVPRIDFRAFQGASEGLWGSVLKGDEPVRLAYLDADNPVFEFCLPGDTPAMTLDMGEGVCGLAPVLQTVIIDKKDNVLSLVWRGCKEYGGLEELAKVNKCEWAVNS